MRASWTVMDSKIEQRVVIKCFIASGKKSAKIFLKLKTVFRNECVLRVQVYEWARRFKGRRRSVYDGTRKWRRCLFIFFDMRRIMHHECVPPYQTVTAKFYLEVLGRLRVRIMRVRIMTMHWHIHLSRYANIWREKIPTSPHPPYSPNLALCDFFLFTKLKTVLKGTQFNDLEEIKAKGASPLGLINQINKLINFCCIGG